MKKQDLLALIRAYAEKDDFEFRRIASSFAVDFANIGDIEIARQISSYLSDSLSFVPQASSISSSFFRKISNSELDSAQVFWPAPIYEDIQGVTNAIKKRNGVCKFLFYGASGTGKTETVKIIASIAKCDLWLVDFSSLVDYRLGETAKNIADMFQQISSARDLRHVIFLFDEIDSIALDRVNLNDLREMGRATSAFLQGMDSLPPDACIIATTNLHELMDKALLRRFDAEICFDAYSKEDLIEVGASIYSILLKESPNLYRDENLFRKIIGLSDPLLLPGDLKNLLRSCIAFGGDDEPCRYLQLLLRKIAPALSGNPEALSKAGFTMRQIAILTGVSKSTISRRILKDG